MLTEYFNALAIFTNAEIEEVVSFAKTRKIKKFDFFIREGETCKEVAFLVSGIFRSFYVSNEGEEITYCITFPNNLMSAYSSFITGQATPENIQAITEAEVLVIPKRKIDELVKENPNWVKFLKLTAEQQYLELEKRIFQLQRDSASERYASLVKNQPEYVQHIPLQYLATYLGITQRHLSRIRKETI